MIKIVIARDFTDAPGPRSIKDGPFSGELFRNEILEPKFKEALNNNDKIVVDLDGGFGYIDSFLEEAFGGLTRIYGKKLVKEKITIISNEERSLIEKIANFIEEANDR